MISDRNPEVHFYIVKVAAVENCRCIVAVLPQRVPLTLKGALDMKMAQNLGHQQ
jgi:hypothetical protein